MKALKCIKDHYYWIIVLSTSSSLFSLHSYTSFSTFLLKWKYSSIISLWFLSSHNVASLQLFYITNTPPQISRQLGVRVRALSRTLIRMRRQEHICPLLSEWKDHLPSGNPVSINRILSRSLIASRLNGQTNSSSNGCGISVLLTISSIVFPTERKIVSI